MSSVFLRFCQWSIRQLIAPVSLPYRSNENEHLWNWARATLASDVFIFTPLVGYTLLLSSYMLFYNVTLVIKKNLTWILNGSWEKAMKKKGKKKRKIGFYVKALLVICESVNHNQNETFKSQQHNTSVPLGLWWGKCVFFYFIENITSLITLFFFVV